MATIYVGSARIDENGNATGGSAGDQKQTSSTWDTAGEVSFQKMYTHTKGWYILRLKDISKASKVANAMKIACNNANLGYDQSNRLGVIKNGIKSTVKTECDCSSLVRACLIYAGCSDPGNFRTATEVSMLEATGLFYDKIAYVSQSKTPVYNGDILVTKTSGHTVIVVKGNPTSNRPDATTTTSTTKASTVSYTVGKVYTTQVDRLTIRKGAGTNYSKVLRVNLTSDAKTKCYSGVYSYLKKGSTVTCKATKVVDGDTWVQIPSGWIAGYYDGKTYLK